jgi:hypothetical protein
MYWIGIAGGLALALGMAAAAPAAAPEIQTIGSEESLPTGQGRLPSIATDSRDQPHIVCDGGSYAYFYDRIGGAWRSVAVDLAQSGYRQFYNPHLEIDRHDRAWVSGIIIWPLGVFVRTNAAANPTTPILNEWRLNPDSWDTGNISIDLPLDEVVGWGSAGYWQKHVFDPVSARLTRLVAKGRMYCGVGGEANTIWISRAGPAIHADQTVHSVWHMATEAHQGYGYSYYQNSLRFARRQPSVAWADPAYFVGMGTDGAYCSIVGDHVSREVAYIACDLNSDGGQGGVYANVYNGTSMVYGIQTMRVVDRAGGSGLRRFAPQWAAARDGGAFLSWTRAGRIRVRYFGPDGAPGTEVDVCEGARAAICADTQGDLHLAYTHNGMKYRKLTLARPVVSPYVATRPADFDGSGACAAAVYEPRLGRWHANRVASGANLFRARSLGGPGELPVIGDFDGDAVDDLGVYNPTGRSWAIQRVADSNWVVNGRLFGPAGGIPAAGDFDGDGADDLCVYIGSNNSWYAQTIAPSNLWSGISFGPTGATAVVGDFDGDGRDDAALYRAAYGLWYARASASGAFPVWERQWGYPGAVPVARDFNGDGVCDLAVADPRTGYWFAQGVNSNLLLWGLKWGGGGRVPVAADFNGDGRVEVGAYNASNGVLDILLWRGLRGGPPDARWHLKIPVRGDYNGDGQTDLAVYDTFTGDWSIRELDGSVIAWSTNWGWSEAQPVPGDYDGDGVADLAVYHSREGQWYIARLDGTVLAVAYPWGWSEAQPVPGDYDGDGADDLAVYHPASGFWFVRSLKRETNILFAINWGYPAAMPVPGDYDGDGRADLAVYDTNLGFWFVRALDERIICLGTNWGWRAATPAAGDYDGDGQADLAVYHAAAGRWYVRTLAGAVLDFHADWGWEEATAAPANYLGRGAAELAVFNSGYWFIRSSTQDVLRVRQTLGAPDAVPVGGAF